MKIGVLTQPLGHNYGGVMQAWALQTVLRGMGHKAVVFNRRYRFELLSTRIIFLRVLSVCKCLVLKYVFRRKDVHICNPLDYHYYPRNDEPRSDEISEPDLNRFVRKHIALTKRLYTTEALSDFIRRKGFDVIVVGSDQVWRQEYSPCITDYFLAFLPENCGVKRIAYAASIGTEKLDIEKEVLPICAESLKRFDALSVREENAREELAAVFGAKASVLLDPTLLLPQTVYERLISSKSKRENAGIVHYILDGSDDKNNIIRSAADALKMSVAALLDGRSQEEWLDVSEWLSAFANAQFVITDSFHGCVFSIIFHKPFIAIANQWRGLSRFTTLLGHFGLRHRLVFSFEEFEVRKRELLTPIDYATVEEKLRKLRSESMTFLKESLS